MPIIIMPIISSLQVSLLSPSGKGRCGKKGKTKLPPAPFHLADKEMKLVSKAFERSRKIPTENSPRSKAVEILSCKSISVSAVE